MNTDWDKAIEFVLKMEGGLTSDPADPGGLTNFGISQKAYPSLNIKDLTVDQAKEIYLRDYWRACSCDELASPFAIAVFDMAVNQGVGKAKRLLQITLGVEADGIIGQKTVSESFKADGRHVKLFLAERLAAYARLMAEKQNLLHFAVNWSLRVISLAELILPYKKTVETPI